MIKISPIKTLKHPDVTTTKNLVQDRPIIKHLKSHSKQHTTPTTTTTTKAMTKKPDILMNLILHRLKSDSLRSTLTSEVYRMKTLCSDSYIAVRKYTIVAKANEEKAFSSKYCKFFSAEKNH